MSHEREDFDRERPIPPERWGRDHWTVIAYAFSRAGRLLDRAHMRIAGQSVPGLPNKEYPTRLQDGVDLYGHDDLDCLSDAEAAGLIDNVGTGLHPCARFTAQGLVLAQWLVGGMEDKTVTTATLTWADALAGSGAHLAAPVATNPYRDAIIEIARILAPEGCEDLCARTFAEGDLPDLVHAVRSRVSSVGCTTGDDDEPVWLHAEMEPRYWEDATVNGVEDTEGKLIPLRSGDTWDLWIDIATGRIEGWPAGTTAAIHYKVCDQGAYEVCGADRRAIRAAENGSYVPGCMSPKGNGYGDYVIMDIGPDGVIDGWRPLQALLVGA